MTNNDVEITRLLTASDAASGEKLAELHHAETKDLPYVDLRPVKVAKRYTPGYGGYRVTERGKGGGHVYWATTRAHGEAYVGRWNALVAKEVARA